MCLDRSESNGKSKKVHPRDCAMSRPEPWQRRAMDLDLVGRDPTPDGVGMSIPIIPAARAAVLAIVSLQLIALVHQSGPVTGVRRRALAALSTSDVWRVGHQLSTGSCGPCLGPTAGARE